MLTIQQLPFPRWEGLKHIKEFVLPSDLFLEQWTVPAGTTVKIYKSANFGICVLAPETKDKRDFVIPRRIFRY